MKFHRRCGDRVTLLNDNSTAIRNFVEFNHGLILSAEPLEDDVMFEVSIDRKVNVWNGSLEIGVTTLDPEYMELPATATKLRNTAWILSGSSIVKDGNTLVNPYGPELDSLREGDCIGVTRTNKAELLFYVNGRCLGVAARDLPTRLFAVIDLYGQCVQVSIIQINAIKPIMDTSVDQIEEDPNNDDSLTEVDICAGTSTQFLDYVPKRLYPPILLDSACALVAQDRLRFHPRCGILVKLSANNKSAERARPLDDYNNGVVMTHRPLYENELFEIRIDRLVDKWSGSIEVGVTTHNPATIRFPSTMTNMETGTIMMSGCKVLFNGHGTCLEYGNFNLDELREGDTVGMMRKSSGKLHYFINGVDQGVATDQVEQHVWGVVDLYGMTVKVSIVDPCEDIESNVQINIPGTPEPSTSQCRPQIDEDSLLFHTLRDSNVIIINDGKTAHRPNAFELFNNGIVMTSRTLKTNEMFQVRLDLVISKWAGSIEIGVTQHSSNDIQLPFKMSNAKSGTWAVTGEDVIHDGAVIIPQYVKNLDSLVEGDTVGVMRKDVGILHFFVNGVDQGPAAFNIPVDVFGIIDLYGRVAQATIVDTYMPPLVYTPESPLSSESNAPFPEMCFHRVHGRNGRLSRNRLTASRATVYSEFNDAVMFSARPLRECDMFELRIDKIIDCWIGSLELGVTAIRPDDLEADGGVGAIAGTATDLNWDTYILSGAAMMKDGECVRSGYSLDLDKLNVGSRVGMMWHADKTIHYYLDGMDMGKAWYVPHLNIYAVVDLYGQCTQVTILHNEERAFNYNGCTNSENSLLSNSRALSSPPPPYWSFSEYCGNNIILKHNYSVAGRLTVDPMAAIVFSSAHLALDEIFEIKIINCKSGFAGSFRMGVTDVNILNANVNRHMPPAIKFLPHFTAYVDGRYMKYSRPGTVKEQDIISFFPSFEWLRPGDRVGLLKTSDTRVVIYYNSEPLDIAFENVPDKVYVVMEIYGPVTKIQAVPRGNNALITSMQLSYDDCVKQPTTTVARVSAKSATPAINMRSNIECNDILEYLETYTSNVTVENELEFYELAFHELPFSEYSYDDTPPHRSPVYQPPNEHLDVEPLICESPGNAEPPHQPPHIETLFDEQPYDDPPCFDPPSYDPSCYDSPSYDPPCFDPPCYDPPCYDPPCFDPPCFDPPCYDLPGYDTPSNGTPCNETSFSEPTDKDVRNMPPIKESQLMRATNVSSLSEPLHKEDTFSDVNEPMSSRSPLVESLEDGLSTSELPINESPINDESSLIDLPFSDLSDNEAPAYDPLVLVTEIPDDEPQLDEQMDRTPTASDLPLEHLPVNDSPLMDPLFSRLSVKDLPICDPSDNERLANSLADEEPVDKPEVSGAPFDKPVVCEAPAEKPKVSEVPVDKPAPNEGPINKPVVCEDPVDNPEVNEVPVNKPDVSNPLVNKLEVSEVSVDKPEVNEVPVNKPDVSNPLVNKLEVSEVSVDKPEVSEVPVDKPNVNKALVYKLEVSEALVDKPEICDVSVDKPDLNETLINKLEVSEASIDKPMASDVQFDNSFVVEAPVNKPDVSEALVDKLEVNEVSIDQLVAMEVMYDNSVVVEALVNRPEVTEAQVIKPNTELSIIEPPTSEPQVTEAKITEVLADAVAISNNTATTAPTESYTHSSPENVASESFRRRPPLPYTFHYVHGKNIKLCSSDTVAVRTTGYKHGVTIVSQPLKRGHNFRFRVDKLNVDWVGGATIGAVGYLPLDDLPPCAMHLDPPIWIVSGEVLQDNGTITTTNMASELDELCEHSVLTIYFRLNSDIVIDIDGKMLGSIGTVPRMYSHVFPLIDLYGRIQQVSVLLHPYVVMRGASLDLPMIAENHSEESLAELDLDLDEHDPSHADLNDSLIVPETFPMRNNKAFSHDNLLDHNLEPIFAQPGPSSISDPAPKVFLPFDKGVSNSKLRRQKIGTHWNSLHYSLTLSEKCILINKSEMVNRCLQKSHSTQSFRHVADETILPTEVKDALQHTFSTTFEPVDDDIVIHGFFDTNIRHNDPYPEANDVDNLDNEIMDALTLETGNLPDLTEEQSSSFDDSTRRDDYWSEPLVVENLIYLNRILCLDQDGAEGQSLESEWEASGEGCEHLHLALKYWNYLVLPYPELRQAVLWGQVRCYCSNCQPDAPDDLADWVRIERIDGVGAVQRAFWHVVRSTLGSAQAVASEPGTSRRPRSLAAAPSTSPTYTDIWFDEEGKPHRTVLAIEIDIEGPEAESDRLLAFLIYLKTNVFVEDNPLSLDE